MTRLRVSNGSFYSISHDVNQPLSDAIQTGLGNLFASTPLAILQPRTAIAWQFEPNTVLRTGFGLFSDISAGKRCRPGRSESALRSDISRAVCLEPLVARRLLPECPTVRSMQPSRRISSSVQASRRASFPAHLRWQTRRPVFRRSQSRRFRMASFTRRTSCSGV